MSAREPRMSEPGFAAEMRSTFKRALAITVVSSCIGLVANLVHPEAIPFIASKDYETLVPCPVPGGPVEPVEASDPVVTAGDSLLVDARPSEAFRTWSMKGAFNVPYDYLDPTPEHVLQEIARRIAASRAARVIVFGDGENPDTGEQLAKEISARGIKNVMFVKGGAPVLERLHKPEGGRR